MLNSMKLIFIIFSNLNKKDFYKVFRIKILYLMFFEIMFDKNLVRFILFISLFG